MLNIGATPGRTISLGAVACLAGICVSGIAGMSKEQKAATVKEFNFGKGMLVATFSRVII